MVVRLRLARHGTRNNPFYHLVAIADHKPRDALPIEKLGEYDPIPRPAAFRPPKLDPNAPVLSSGLPGRAPVAPGAAVEGSKAGGSQPAKLEKRLELDGNRIKYWLSVGAQPSKPVAKMLDKAGLIPEGKFYKGMYRHPLLEPHSNRAAALLSSSSSTAAASTTASSASAASAGSSTISGAGAGAEARAGGVDTAS